MSKDKKKSKKAAKAEKTAKSVKKVAKKSTKAPEVPAVLRKNNIVDLVQHNLQNNEDASDRLKSLTKKDISLAIDTYNATIWGHVARGGKVQLMPYITHYPVVRLPRKGRNPRTGEEIQIGASVSFGTRAGKGLKELMNADESIVKKLVKQKMEEKAAREAKKAEKAKASATKKAKKKSA